jgi:hypothetical protein
MDKLAVLSQSSFRQTDHRRASQGRTELLC